MDILKNIKEKNIEINFVMKTLKGFETTLYFNKLNGYIHRKMIYSNIKMENVKVNSTKKVRIDDDKCKFIVIVEEKQRLPKQYTVYVRDDDVIEAISLTENHIITSDVLQFINEKISEENKQKEVKKTYMSLPEAVRKCYPLEDFDQLEDAISENIWYSNQKERLILLPYVLGSENIIRWLSKLGISSISKDLDSLAIYVAFRLTRCLSNLDKELVIKTLSKYIPKGDEKFYSDYFG